ncbi:MAG: uncharacterized protein K0R98_769 [Rickettsiaceae bacterium]|jgi:uncharacterized protein|nr:uncharacterized protein [Rickettsiaceae bacterium]
MDITPAIPRGKNILKGYGDMAFNINDVQYQGSVILLPDDVQKWEVADFAEISVASVEIIINNIDIEIMLIGCGEIHQPLPLEIRNYFVNRNIGVEVMTTGAACRTYNVLMAEGRLVAAALIAV